MIHPNIRRFYHRVAEYLWKKQPPKSLCRDQERQLHDDWVDAQTERLSKGYEAAFERAWIKRNHPSRFDIMYPNGGCYDEREERLFEGMGE